MVGCLSPVHHSHCSIKSRGLGPAWHAVTVQLSVVLVKSSRSCPYKFKYPELVTRTLNMTPELEVETSEPNIFSWLKPHKAILITFVKTTYHLVPLLEQILVVVTILKCTIFFFLILLPTTCSSILPHLHSATFVTSSNLFLNQS